MKEEEQTITENKKPIYKRWWFIVLILLIVGGMLMDEEESSSNSSKTVADDDSSKTICIESTNVQKRGGVYDGVLNGKPKYVNHTYYLVNQQEPFTGNNSCKYLSNGQQQSKGRIKKGKKDGKWTYWYENGQKWEEGNYKDGIPKGNWNFWMKSGTQLSREDIYTFQRTPQ